VYLGNYYEWTAAGAKSYYYAGNVRVAVRTGNSPGTINYLLGDHLGSTSLTTDSNGARVAELRYYPYGKTRYPSDPAAQAGAAPTTFRFTGQRWQQDTRDLYFYQSRWYDPLVGRFLSADTIVPDPKSTQALNRYSYTLNNPTRYVDPTGHCISTDTACLAALKALQEQYGVVVDDRNQLWALEQLLALQAGFRLLAENHAGGIAWFRDTFAGTKLVREDRSTSELITNADGTLVERYTPAITLRRTVTFYNDAFAPGNDASLTTIHELAHVWDTNSGDALSKGLVSATGGEQDYIFLGRSVSFDLGFLTPLGAYRPQGQTANAPQAGVNRREDWAWSLTVTLAPHGYTIGDTRRDYVQKVMSGESR
jgi:RHS repeat-associated protein